MLVLMGYGSYPPLQSLDRGSYVKPEACYETLNMQRTAGLSGAATVPHKDHGTNLLGSLEETLRASIFAFSVR